MQNLKLKVPAAHLFSILVIFILKTDFYLEKTNRVDEIKKKSWPFWDRTALDLPTAVTGTKLPFQSWGLMA